MIHDIVEQKTAAYIRETGQWPSTELVKQWIREAMEEVKQ